jgi:hypothetical protein
MALQSHRIRFSVVGKGDHGHSGLSEGKEKGTVANSRW